MIDIYCERLSPAFWAEPVNALTNLGFLVAAMSGWRLYRGQPSADAACPWLIILIAVIGAGSFLFHTFATSWAAAADILPILAFQVAYLWVYGRSVIGWRTGTGILAIALFLAAILIAGRFDQMLNGSLAYAPAVATLGVLAAFHSQRAVTTPHTLPAAAGLLLVSLMFRTLDDALCTAIPVGTHFLWHLLNSVVLYLAMRGLIIESAVRTRAR
jgi:hypothetical protein